MLRNLGAYNKILNFMLRNYCNSMGYFLGKENHEFCRGGIYNSRLVFNK